MKMSQPITTGQEEMETHTHTLPQKTHIYQLTQPAGGAEVTPKAPLGAPRAQIRTLSHFNLGQR